MKNFVWIVPVCMMVMISSLHAQQSRSSRQKNASTKPKAAKLVAKEQAAQRQLAENQLREDAERRELEARQLEERRQLAVKELEVLRTARAKRKELAVSVREKGLVDSPEEQKQAKADLKREIELRKALELGPLQKEVNEIASKLRSTQRKIADFAKEQDKVFDFAPNSGAGGGTRLQPIESRESRDLQRKGLENQARLEAKQKQVVEQLRTKLKDAANRLTAKRIEIEEEYGISILIDMP